MRRVTFLLLTVLGALLPAPSARGQALVIRDVGRVRQPTTHQGPRLPLTRWDANLTVKDGWIELSSEQTFHNRTRAVLEATYLFPLPKGAVARELDLWINGKPVAGEVLSADKAKDVYQSIVRKMRDPALLEYVGQDLLRASIFPIQPGTDARIKMRLVWTAGRVGSLYAAEVPLCVPEGDPTLTVKLDISSDQGVGNVFSPSHPLDVVRKGENAAVASYEGRAGARRRLTVYYGTGKTGPGVSLLCHRISDPGHFLLSLYAPRNLDAPRLPRDVVFVLDRSGSMKDGKLEQAVEALKHGLSTLNEQDRFEVITFSTEPFSVFQGLVNATVDHKSQAAEHLGRARASGGTALADALVQGLGVLDDSNRMQVVVFLTDGEPTIGETRPEAILTQTQQKAGKKTRLFCFGVGHDLNARLLDLLAEQNRGASDYVLPDENLELRVSAFFDRVSEPVVEAVSVQIEGVVTREIYPKEIGDLFAGSAVHLLGLYEGSGAARVVMTGRTAAGRFEKAFDVTFGAEETGHDSLRPLYASRKVAYLLAQIQRHGMKNELKDEIIRLGREYGIVTPYTSALVVEEGEALALGAGLRRFDADDFGAAPPNERASGGARGGFARKAGEAGGEAEVDRRLRELERLDRGRKAVEESARLGRLAQRAALPATGGASGPSSPGASRREGKKGDGENLGVRHAGGRTFLKAGEAWIDRSIDMEKWEQRQSVEAFSDAYFELLDKVPLARAYAALGVHVAFEHEGTIYEIVPPKDDDKSGEDSGAEDGF